MARRLILDWRSDQLVALVTKDALDVAFEASYVINDLPHGNVPMASIDAAREPLRRMIQELGLRRVATTVLLGREFFELQPIVLPPAPESDWPDMVAFQAPLALGSGHLLAARSAGRIRGHNPHRTQSCPSDAVSPLE